MFELYRFYFLTLCGLHPSLLHTDTNRVFRVVHIEEAFGDFRTEVAEKKFIFRLIVPTYGFAGQGSNGIRRMQCGFLLARHFDNRTEGGEGFTKALEECRKTADDFFVKMVEDSRLGYPLFGHAANRPGGLNWNAQALAPAGDGTYAGLLCTFELQEPVTICLEQHTDTAWRQPTPGPLAFWLTADGARFLNAGDGKFLLS